MKNILAEINHDSIFECKENKILSITVVETKGRIYYDMSTFIKIYGSSYATLDRYIQKLAPSNALSCIHLNNKKYLSESYYWKEERFGLLGKNFRKKSHQPQRCKGLHQ